MKKLIIPALFVAGVLNSEVISLAVLALIVLGFAAYMTKAAGERY